MLARRACSPQCVTTVWLCRELEYEDVWAMFREGRHPHIERLLETKLAPFLSQSATPLLEQQAVVLQAGALLPGGHGEARPPEPVLPQSC